MSDVDIKGHILTGFDKDMEKLQRRVVRMGQLVKEQLNMVKEALGRAGVEAIGQEIIENDDQIDRLEVKADRSIVKILARRSPMGMDLRYIICASRVVTDLERLGDEVVQIARTLLEEKHTLGQCDNVSAMVEVKSMLFMLDELCDRVCEAFERFDEVTAREIAFGAASTEGELQKRIDHMKACTGQDEDVSAAVGRVLVLRSMERALRYIQNISEHIIFLVTAEDVRHQS